MSKHNNINYRPFDQFVFRTPRYPIHLLTEALDNPDRIKELMQDKAIKEIIYLGSPVLANEIDKLIDGKILQEKERLSIKASFVKYLSRMCARCTPYGLFATCSSGKVGKCTNLSIKKEVNRHTRLDMYYLSELTRYLSKQEEIKNQLRYFANTTIYVVGNTYRYIECKYQGDRHFHIISSVQRNKYLEEIIRQAATGIKYDSIVNYLIKLDIDKTDAIEYIDSLIDNQLLQGELEQFFIEDSFFDRISLFLEKIDFHTPEILQIRNFISGTKKQFHHLDNTTNGNKMSLYNSVLKNARKLPVPVEEKCFFQVDTGRESENTEIGEDIITELRSLLAFFNKTASFTPDRRLNGFKNAFYERYEEQEIPLLEALDPNIGIGYPPKHGIFEQAPLLATVSIPGQQNSNFKYVTVNELLLKKLLAMEHNGQTEIVFEDSDLANLEENKSGLPPTLFFMFQLLKKSDGYNLLNVVIGTSAAKLMGRFAYMDDDIKTLVEKITKKEQEYGNGNLYAEIIHLPASRVGNIIIRPHIRDYEILLLANSDIPEESKIPASDLMLSFRNGELVLRSKKLGKRILPRLTNAHNYYNDTQPIYKLLCDMQYQNTTEAIIFNWGGLSDTLTYHPRVRYKNTILSAASWSILKSEIKDWYFVDLKKVNAWREKREMPRYVYLEEGDNVLFVDFSSPDSINTLISAVKNKEKFILKEFLFDDMISFKGKDDGYINECIVPFYQDEKK